MHQRWINLYCPVGKFPRFYSAGSRQLQVAREKRRRQLIEGENTPVERSTSEFCPLRARIRVQIPDGPSRSNHLLPVFSHELPRGKPMVKGNPGQMTHRSRFPPVVSSHHEASKYRRQIRPQPGDWKIQGANTWAPTTRGPAIKNLARQLTPLTTSYSSS